MLAETTIAPTGKVQQSREVVRIVEGMPASDGAGVKLTRVIGTPTLSDLDPFLMLDEFGSDEASDYLAGFPDHPHRGFETVTYMLAGRMRHRDNQGNSGLLLPGGAQWMTAGKGIVHSEMSEQISGRMAGFQLWVNLPAREKMSAPRYQDIEPARIPEVALDGGGVVRVVAGSFAGVAGPVSGVAADPTFLDIHLPARGGVAHDLPSGHTAFAYVYEGAVEIGPSERRKPIARGRLAVFGPGTSIAATSAEGGRFILVAGRPIGEPVAKYGPFVMNTPDEIRQAIRDFQEGRF